MADTFSVDARLALVALAQFTACISLGLIASYVWRDNASRAHRGLLLGLGTAIATPAVSLCFYFAGFGQITRPSPLSRTEVDAASLSVTTLGDSTHAVDTMPVVLEKSANHVAAGQTPAVGPRSVSATGESVDASLGSAGVNFVFALLIAWAAVSSVLLLRLLISFFSGRRILRNAEPVENSSLSAGQDAARRLLGIRSTPRLLMSGDVDSPVIWCWSRQPVLLFPQALPACTDWQGILCHELAHFQRRDHLSSIFSQVMTAVLPWHPLCWWAKRRLALLSEQACDDWALVGSDSPADYAQSLLNQARQAGPIWALAAVSSPSTLAIRLKRILTHRRSTPQLGKKWILATTTIAVLFVATFALAQFGEEPNSNSLIESKAAPKIALADEDEKKLGSHPITVSGRALDADGKPIAGARIFLVAQVVDHDRFGETKTDTDGRFVFRDAPLPIKHSDTVGGRDVGCFMLYGKAIGHGFAWRPTKWYYPEPNPDLKFYELSDEDLPRHFQKDEKIELDLHFAKSTTVRGRVVDEKGNGIADTRLELWDCEKIPADGYGPPSNTAGRKRFNVFDNNGFEMLNADVPPAMRIVHADPDGRFEFTDLPAGCRFRVKVIPPGFAQRMEWIATQAGLSKTYDDDTLHNGLENFELKFDTPKSVPVRVVYEDTGKPAKDVLVGLYSHDAGSTETSNEEGQATLSVPPGEYSLSLLPAYKTPYLESRDKIIKIEAEGATGEQLFQLPAGTAVEIHVVDADTGAGLPDVDLWCNKKGRERDEYYSTSFEVATRIVHRDRRRTDDDGVIHEVFSPGKHRIGAGYQSYPTTHEPVEPNGVEIDCKPGEKLKVTLSYRRKAEKK